jgi:N-methylhydantoinase B
MNGREASQTLSGTDDAIDIEILWRRLLGVADEAAAVLVRTAFSPVVREANDYTCGLTDTDGTCVAENGSALGGFSGAVSHSLRYILEQFPLPSWREGDSILTNDPWQGSGHLPDLVLTTPLWHRRRVVGFIVVIMHATDIGGASWSIGSRDVFEEGIRIPATKVFLEGRPNDDVFRVLAANVRVPDQVLGDIAAAKAAANICNERVSELLDDHRLTDIADLSTQIVERTERQMRRAIRALPDGQVQHCVEMDGLSDPVKIAVSITVRDETLTLDYSGSSPQVAWAGNCPYVTTYAHTTYALKCLLDPVTPRSDGAFRPVRVVAPEQSVVHPSPPAPVAARQLVIPFLNAAVMGAMAAIIPERVLAESGLPNMQVVYRGVQGRPYVAVPFEIPGMGAGAGQDGLSATPYPANAGGASIEILEATAPLLYLRRGLRQDSGGAGRHRGGLGEETIVQMLSDSPTTVSVMGDRVVRAPQGIAGGLAGAAASIRKLPEKITVPAKGVIVLEPGEILHIRQAGGAGYGLADDRPAELVRRDLESGYVSERAARKFYPRQLEQLKKLG